MAVDPGTAISAGTQLVGLVSGKGKKGGPDKVAKEGKELLLQMIRAVRNDDPLARIEAGYDAARERTRQDAETVLGNVVSKFSVQGSLPSLPNTAKNSVLRGALADIERDVTLQEAQDRSTAFERLLQNQAGVVSLLQAGRGKDTPRTNSFNAGAFSTTFGDLLKQSGVSF